MFLRLIASGSGSAVILVGNTARHCALGCPDGSRAARGNVASEDGAGGWQAAFGEQGTSRNAEGAGGRSASDLGRAAVVVGGIAGHGARRRIAGAVCGVAACGEVAGGDGRGQVAAVDEGASRQAEGAGGRSASDLGRAAVVVGGIAGHGARRRIAGAVCGVAACGEGAGGDGHGRVAAVDEGASRQAEGAGGRSARDQGRAAVVVGGIAGHGARRRIEGAVCGVAACGKEPVGMAEGSVHRGMGEHPVIAKSLPPAPQVTDGDPECVPGAQVKLHAEAGRGNNVAMQLVTTYPAHGLSHFGAQPVNVNGPFELQVATAMPPQLLAASHCTLHAESIDGAGCRHAACDVVADGGGRCALRAWAASRNAEGAGGRSASDLGRADVVVGGIAGHGARRRIAGAVCGVAACGEVAGGDGCGQVAAVDEGASRQAEGAGGRSASDLGRAAVVVGGIAGHGARRRIEGAVCGVAACGEVAGGDGCGQVAAVDEGASRQAEGAGCRSRNARDLGRAAEVVGGIAGHRARSRRDRALSSVAACGEVAGGSRGQVTLRYRSATAEDEFAPG
eukprot:CAMPEP_0204611072 /NCGR_PEP_ID=MMETSP0661-20131031/61833_1 /ASSEMBLY_ACC=CAM_ASM_000606 /TAXON_ID=109239 /ORGANISM="Alexandrium margalefi, Strain AMGDE01CS-322" /LENGTH=562 /DNA_ID=CAMNT_0051622911 /DNA_START=990 /DNA_END=2679 /DNA_ORIENTATION=-